MTALSGTLGGLRFFGIGVPIAVGSLVSIVGGAHANSSSLNWDKAMSR